MHLKKGASQHLTCMKHNLDTERHPTLSWRNEDRIRITSGTVVQINIHNIYKINIHHITKREKFNTTMV
jgi:hypothetical protein